MRIKPLPCKITHKYIYIYIYIHRFRFLVYLGLAPNYGDVTARPLHTLVQFNQEHERRFFILLASGLRATRLEVHQVLLEGNKRSLRCGVAKLRDSQTLTESRNRVEHPPHTCTHVSNPSFSRVGAKARFWTGLWTDI